MKHLQTLESYLDECGHISRVIDALAHFAPQRGLDAGEMFEEFSKYRMVRNPVAARGGQIDWNKKQIELHAELLISGREEYRDQTLLHETAHLIIILLFPESKRRGNRIKPHGREWKTVMRQMGCRPDRCCDYDFLHEARAKKANLIYACQHCEHEFPAQRRWKNVESKYHPKCGRKLGRLYLKRDVTGRTYPSPSKAAA